MPSTVTVRIGLSYLEEQGYNKLLRLSDYVNFHRDLYLVRVI